MLQKSTCVCHLHFLNPCTTGRILASSHHLEDTPEHLILKPDRRVAVFAALPLGSPSFSSWASYLFTLVTLFPQVLSFSSHLCSRQRPLTHLLTSTSMSPAQFSPHLHTPSSICYWTGPLECFKGISRVIYPKGKLPSSPKPCSSSGLLGLLLEKGTNIPQRVCLSPFPALPSTSGSSLIPVDSLRIEKNILPRDRCTRIY